MNWLDWVLIGLVGWGALQGFRRGFLLLLAETAGALLALYLAARYDTQIVAWLEARFGLVGATANFVARRFAQLSPAAAAGAGVPLLPEWFAGAGATLPAQFATRLAELLWTGVAFLAGAVAIGTAVRVVAGLLSLVAEGAALGFPNRLAGAALGATRNALVLGAIVGVILPLLAGPHFAGTVLTSPVAAALGRLVARLIAAWTGARFPPV